MNRREFLAGAAGMAGASAVSPGASGAAAARRTAVYFLPGYRPDLAHQRGLSVLHSPELRRQLPSAYDGPATLVTRIDEADGSIGRALMPIRGHAIAMRPDRQLAVWNSMEGDTVLSFDPTSLELASLRGFEGEAIVGGGHAVFTRDGSQVIVTERRRLDAYTGHPADHYGQVSIRDAATLQTLETFSTHGMAPHDLALLADGKHIAIAHYGSHLPEGAWRPQIVEPCLVILELSSGRLVDKLSPPDRGYELRHLAAGGLERLAAVLVRRGSREEEATLLAGRSEVYEADSSTRDAGAYLPGPLITFNAERRPAAASLALPPDPLLARQGQSMAYDPLADEMLVTFTSSHAVGVFAGSDGRVKQVFSTEPLGLRYPRGIALHPDGVHYAVSGSWRDLTLFRRGTHAPARSIYAVLFEHSHLAIG